jgi:hypothetical protein
VGAAGTDALAAASDEAQRIADYVVGPWQINAALIQRDPFATTALAAPPNVAVAVVYPLTTSGSGKPWADIAQSYGFIAGFTTGRASTDNAKARAGFAGSVNRTPRLDRAEALPCR